MIRPLLNVIGFLTIYPVGMPESLERVAKHMVLFPFVGLTIGIIAGFATELLGLFLPLSITSALGLFILLAITGLHHFDGVLDFGDALFFRGPKQRRIAVLHDTNTGTGGVTLGIFTILITFLLIFEFMTFNGRAIVFFTVSEVLAKFSLHLGAIFGKPAFEGMGSTFIRTAKKQTNHIIISFSFTGLVTTYFFPPYGFLLLIIPVITVLIMSSISNRLVGGMSGDVFGALNEFTRLSAMAVVLWML